MAGVNKNYGRWVSHLKELEKQILNGAEIDDEVILASPNLKLSAAEFRKLVFSAFRQTKHDHGSSLIQGWESSFLKRLWGNLKQLSNQQRTELQTKQLEQIKFLQERTNDNG